MYCDIHIRYRGKGKPKIACATCWERYLSDNPDIELSKKDLKTLLSIIVSYISDKNREERYLRDEYY